MHERGLALSRNGHLAAVLTKVENSKANTSRLIVYRLGVPSEGSEHAAPLLDYMFAATDRITGVAFNANREDDPEDDPEEKTSVKVFVYGMPDPKQTAEEGAIAKLQIVKGKRLSFTATKNEAPLSPTRAKSEPTGKAKAEGVPSKPGDALFVFTIQLGKSQTYEREDAEVKLFGQVTVTYLALTVPSLQTCIPTRPHPNVAD